MFTNLHSFKHHFTLNTDSLKKEPTACWPIVNQMRLTATSLPILRLLAFWALFISVALVTCSVYREAIYQVYIVADTATSSVVFAAKIRFPRGA